MPFFDWLEAGGVRPDWFKGSCKVTIGDALGGYFGARHTHIFGPEIKLICDPEDLTRYSHWFQEKHLQTTTRIYRDSDARLGYCKMLARRMARNDRGSELIRIRVFKVHYNYPSPDDDAHAFLTEQTGPPADQIDAPFWEYDVASDKGKWLD